MIRPLAVLAMTMAGLAAAQGPADKAIDDQLRQMRKVPDKERGKATRKLALTIRGLPAGDEKVSLALRLASLSTEGDFGTKALREVAATLAGALAEKPQPEEKGAPARPYLSLAELARYERVAVELDSPSYRAALGKLEEIDRRRAAADFRLKDLDGKEWSLRGLRGKVVLVNFWATWCPPCRKEFPDMQGLYRRFSKKGLVILAVSDDQPEKIREFIAQQQAAFPVLLDTGGKVAEEFAVEGIPKSFVYDREGRLAATAIDMRTRRQFLAMLGKAGMQ